MNLSGLPPYGWAQLQAWQRAALHEVLDFCTRCVLSFPCVCAVGLTPAKKFWPCCLHGACAAEALEANSGLLLNFALEQWDTRAFQKHTQMVLVMGEFQPKQVTCSQKDISKSLPQWQGEALGTPQMG